MVQDVFKLYNEIPKEKRDNLEQVIPDTDNVDYLHGALEVSSAIYTAINKPDFEKLFIDEISYKRMCHFVGLMIARILYLQKINEATSKTIH